MALGTQAEADEAGRGADFNGIYFTVGEVEQLVREAGLIPEEFILQTTDETPTAGHIRVTCRRPLDG